MLVVTCSIALCALERIVNKVRINICINASAKGPAQAHTFWHTCMKNTCMKTYHTVILIGNKPQSIKCVRRKDVSR